MTILRNQSVDIGRLRQIITGLSEGVILVGVDQQLLWANDAAVGDRIFRDYEATGNGGQLLIVVPEADLVVVFTAGNYGQGGIWGKWHDEIVAQQIIPAIR